MRSDRRSLLAAGFLLSILPMGRATGQTLPPVAPDGLVPGLPQPTETLDLWPDGAPGLPDTPPVERTVERSQDRLVTDRAVSGIAVPRLVVFRPARPNGAAVLLTPGGGYKHVVVDKEGYEMARWLAARGVTAFVLFYRLPGDGWEAGPDVALSDAQRAMRLIRHRARDYAIEPERVAAMGFSAGGHLCADLATRFAAHTYTPVDAADTLSAKPFCAAPIYPVVSMTPGVAHAGSRDLLIGADAGPSLEKAHSPDRNVPADAPPFFLLHAEDDDAVPVENSVLLRAALKAQGIPVETHLFEHGGHGFGLRKAIGKPVEAWPELWLAWARTRSFV
ncbi:alpha/beta hydrolase [Alteriqipengyuania lutimaris]|uniref:Alpha/beta hydrolase n=1 Tax=Alteriqipengyuania lutimaris TaxID=1538146 RepID=A0A395LJP8_9SPHN|nr:alpha/beta hydrolase [Alteriqipengyuania lutimaris]MBB3035048.1 acetyl esterase/lipase [Alteriqipengyuania lutimaris]RDS75674.1 alpha/beta hydrolase [Alteriqipengyuania lutimaris]